MQDSYENKTHRMKSQPVASMLDRMLHQSFKMVGVNFVNPSVVFKKPLEAIPVTMARTK